MLQLFYWEYILFTGIINDIFIFNVSFIIYIYILDYILYFIYGNIYAYMIFCYKIFVNLYDINKNKNICLLLLLFNMIMF